ncbi:c-type cytochrome [Ilumatobacter sp.]|uniref:c-type cytochrome n=1 Tax=Ilumatobacter sp. TaxID=1967498 RepID=UPI003B5247BC
MDRRPLSSLPATRRSRPGPRRALAAGLLAVAVTACGGSSSGLSEQAERGRQTALDNACSSCHGVSGQGGVGPPWVDLAGSEVQLSDGTTVTADRDYLLRSILEPGVEEVEGYTIRMPENQLTPEQAADVVTYIEELSAPTDE